MAGLDASVAPAGATLTVAMARLLAEEKKNENDDGDGDPQQPEQNSASHMGLLDPIAKQFEAKGNPTRR
jgi:hypothetical protein